MAHGLSQDTYLLYSLFTHHAKAKVVGVGVLLKQKVYVYYPKRFQALSNSLTIVLLRARTCTQGCEHLYSNSVFLGHFSTNVDVVSANQVKGQH